MSRFRLILAGALAVVAVSAVASASASAAPLWFSAGGGTIAPGEPGLLIMGLGEAQVLKAAAAGTTIEIKCSHLDVHGNVINLANLAGHTLQTLLYLGCKISGAGTTGCEVPGEMITISVIGHLLSTTSILFAPDPEGASNFVEIAFFNCAQMGLNNTYPFTGDLLGAINNTNSTVTVNEPKAGSMLSFAGNPASLSSGEVSTLMEGGGGLEVKEP